MILTASGNENLWYKFYFVCYFLITPTFRICIRKRPELVRLQLGHQADAASRSVETSQKILDSVKRSSPTMIILMNWTVTARAPWAALQQMILQVIPPCLIMSLKEEVLVHTVMNVIVRWKRLLWKHHFPILLKVFCSLLKLDLKQFSWKLPMCVYVQDTIMKKVIARPTCLPWAHHHLLIRVQQRIPRGRMRQISISNLLLQCLLRLYLMKMSFYKNYYSQFPFTF